MSTPTPTVEVGIIYTGTTETLEDLTDRTISLSVQRGRSDFSRPFEAGRATLVFRNLDGALDPDNTSSPLYPGIQTNRTVRIKCDSDLIFVGRVNDIDLSYEVEGDATVTVSAVDALAELAQRTIVPFAVSQEPSGDRIQAILTLPEVNFTGGTAIATGVSQIAGGTATGNALAYCQQAEFVEQGALFVDRQGTLTFLDRYETLAEPPQITFSDTAGSAIPYQSIERLVSATELFNRLTANRPDGPLVVEDDTTSQTLYGIREIDLGETLAVSDTQLSALLQYALAKYANALPRIVSLTSFMETAGTATVDLAQLELNDTAEIRFSPPGVAQFAVPAVVESVRHDFTVGSPWRASFGFSPRDIRIFFILDSTDFGVLDTDRLGF